jgi:hypothetical protein
MDLPTVIATERGALDRDTTAETPDDMPNIRVKVMSAASLILIRAARTFLQAFLATLAGGALGPSVPGVSDVLPPGQFGEKALAALYIGGIAALFSAIQNTIELLGRFDTSHPELRA